MAQCFQFTTLHTDLAVVRADFKSTPLFTTLASPMINKLLADNADSVCYMSSLTTTVDDKPVHFSTTQLFIFLCVLSSFSVSPNSTRFSGVPEIGS